MLPSSKKQPGNEISPCFIGNTSSNGAFSIAILVYQRVAEHMNFLPVHPFTTQRRSDDRSMQETHLLLKPQPSLVENTTIWEASWNANGNKNNPQSLNVNIFAVFLCVWVGLKHVGSWCSGFAFKKNMPGKSKKHNV